MSVIHIHVKRHRSFIIMIYDGNLKLRTSYTLPDAITIPFANRLFREVLPEREKSVREPYHKLIPHCVHEGKTLNRPALPTGPTSLSGKRYEPDKEPLPRVRLLPQAHRNFFTVRVYEFQDPIFEGDYSTDDIFLAFAERVVRLLIENKNLLLDEGPFYYEIEISGDEVNTLPKDLFPPEAYKVEGVFQLPQLAKERERIQFRKVPDSILPERDPASFGATRTVGRGEKKDSLIFMKHSVYQALQKDLFLKPKVEDGGYVLGIPYRQPGSPEKEDDPDFRWLIDITDVIQAQGAFGKTGLLLFTGETWSNALRRLDTEFIGKKLVSWFHTHLFKATDDFGLSGLDQDLHRRFFTKPWQVAVLINIDENGEREVRCFQRGVEGDLVECTFEVYGEGF